MKAKIRTVLPFFWLCLLSSLFSGFALAEMSDDEKREFIESLAEPSTEKKTFFRWQDRYNENQKQKKRLLEAGEMTPELYKEFMSYDDPWAGTGFYVSDDIASSHYFGTTIIEVEVEAGYKFLDLDDPKIWEALKKKGITGADVFKLNPEVAVRNIGDEGEGWWVLKKREGIKFKPFSMDRIREKIDKLPIKDTLEGAILFRIAGEQLSQKDVSKIVDKLPWDQWEHASTFFHFAGRYLSKSDISKIMEKMDKLPMDDLIEGISFLGEAGKYLSKSDISKILEKANQFPIDTITGGANYLENVAKLREEGIDISEMIRKKMSQLLKTKRSLSRKGPHEETIYFFKQARKYLPKADRKKFIDLFLPFYLDKSINYLETVLKPDLSELEYNEIAAQFKLRKQGVENNQPSRSSSDETARVRCLKKWLQEP